VVALELDVVLAAVARVMLAFAGDHWADSAHGFPLTLGYFGPFWVILLAVLGHILGYLGYLSTFWVHFGPSLNWVSTGSQLGRATRGLQRVQLCTGHTRQLLPDFAKQSFGAVFMDLWGSQYTEALAAGR